MRFQVVGRITEGCLLVKDIPIPTSQLSSITCWEVLFNKTTFDRNKAMKKSGGGVEVPNDLCDSIPMEGDICHQNEFSDGSIDISTGDNPSLSQDDSNLMLLSQLAGGINKQNGAKSNHHNETQPSDDRDMICAENCVKDDSNFLLLSQLKLDSVSGKRVNFKGTFSFETGDHNAHMGVDFGDDSLPVNVVTNCDLHASTTSDKCFPCKCILEMDDAIRNQKIKWWPSDHAHLHPPACQSEAVRNAVQNHPTPLFLDVPRFGADLKSLSSDENFNAELEAAQKCKHKLSGPRFRSSGEMNSSAKKPPKCKREGKRCVSDVQDTNGENSPPQSPIYYSGNNFMKDHPQKCLPPTTTPHFNTEATGSIFHGHMDSDFISGTTDRTVTVHDWCKRRNKRREQCNSVSLIGVARSAVGEDCVCRFHDVAHVDNQIDDCRRQFFVISEIQLASSGVTRKEDGFHVWLNPDADPIVFPSLELRKCTCDCHDLQDVTILSTHWNPPPLPKSARNCSVCCSPNCKRPKCVQLNLFGLGVSNPKNLIPGNHFVWKTNEKMSSILVGTKSKSKVKHPLEVCASDNNSCIADTFPCKLGQDTNNNLKRNLFKKKKRRKIITKHFLEQQSHHSIRQTSDIGIKRFHDKSNGTFNRCVIRDAE